MNSDQIQVGKRVIIDQDSIHHRHDPCRSGTVVEIWKSYFGYSQFFRIEFDNGDTSSWAASLLQEHP